MSKEELIEHQQQKLEYEAFKEQLMKLINLYVKLFDAKELQALHDFAETVSIDDF